MTKEHCGADQSENGNDELGEEAAGEIGNGNSLQRRRQRVLNPTRRTACFRNAVQVPFAPYLRVEEGNGRQGAKRDRNPRDVQGVAHVDLCRSRRDPRPLNDELLDELSGDVRFA